MTFTLQAVNELIQSLESAGELSIKETKVMALGKAYQQLAAENVALKDCVVNHAPAVEHWNAWAEPEDKIQNAPETPATDCIYSGIKADGVEEFVSNTVHKIFDESEAVSALAYLSLANSHVKQLREGADK